MRWMLMALVLGCGTSGDKGGGADHLPVSGGGPFGALASQPGDLIDAPMVLGDPAVDLDDPFVLADGAALTVWVTAHRAGGDRIERADAPSIRKGFGDLEVALTADQPWEGGGVSAPSIVPGWLLFYWAEGGIGYAVSRDGHSWDKQPGPLLPGAGPPAAVRIGDQIRIYYPKDGSIYAAQGTLDALTDLGQVLQGVPYGTALGRAFARSAPTPAGRIRHDLYFSVTTPTMPTCGWAATYGEVFDAFPTPITDPKQDTRGCTMTPYQADGVDSALALWIERRGSRSVVFAGKSP
jgi:hypothetical protein